MRFLRLLALVAGVLCLPVSGFANSAHPHPPTLKPISSAPSAIKLDDKELKGLDSGEPILRQSRGDDGGRGVAVQLVNASADDVWNTILSYDNYPQWVDNVESCEVYQKKPGQLYVAMKSSFMWITSELFTINAIKRDQGYMSWVLDRTRESDVRDMIGYWRVEQLSETPPLTRLDYATEIVVGGVPDFIVTHLTESSLIDGTAWVKRESEKLAKKRAEAKDTPAKP